MKGVDESGVLFIRWAETFKDDGNKQVHHQVLDNNYENSKVYETNVSSTLLRSIFLHLLPSLCKQARLSIKSAIFTTLPPDDLFWIYRQLSHNEIPILSCGTPYKNYNWHRESTKVHIFGNEGLMDYLWEHTHAYHWEDKEQKHDQRADVRDGRENHDKRVNKDTKLTRYSNQPEDSHDSQRLDDSQNFGKVTSSSIKNVCKHR